MVPPHEQFGDSSERVDPIRAADELIAYATWMQKLASSEHGRRVPTEAQDILSTIKNKRQGIEEVYAAFQRVKPRRDWVTHTKQRMIQELFLNESELVDYKAQL